MHDLLVDQSQLALIAVITLLAVISPGPDFAVTARNSLKQGRRAGLATALGISAGVGVHILYTIFGLGYLLAQAVWLLEIMRYLGAAYLIWLGGSALMSKAQASSSHPPQGARDQVSSLSALRSGFICNALNPKTALFFIALFTQVADPASGVIIQIGLGIFIALAHLLWFALVALLLTHPMLEKRFQHAKIWIERVTGICLLGLGGKLALGS